MPIVRDYDLTAIHPGGGQTPGGQRGRHEAAAEEFAARGDDVEQGRVGAAALLDFLQRGPQVVEVAVEGGQQGRVSVGPQPAGFIDVTAAQDGEALLDLPAFVPGPSGFGERQQTVRHPPEGRHDHNRSPPPAAFGGHN